MEFMPAFALKYSNRIARVCARTSLIVLVGTNCVVSADGGVARSVDQADRDCHQGYYHLAIEPLRKAYESEAEPALKARTAADLSRAYIQTNNTEIGTEYLIAAINQTADPLAKAKLLVNLGNIRIGQKRWNDADMAYDQALAIAPVGDIGLTQSVTINRLRKLSLVERLAPLTTVANNLSDNLSRQDQSRFLTNIGYQALELQPEAKALAFQTFSRAMEIARLDGDSQLLVEIYDGLSDLYERDGRIDDSRYYVEQALGIARASASPLLLTSLESRLGRLLKSRGDDDLAITAYRRAVQHIESARSEIPITYQDGKSSFRETLEPVYLGLTDLLIRKAATVDGHHREQLLREALKTVELVKQTELQDYLHDRCSVGAVSSGKALSIPVATAVYYPVILNDRLELLIETKSGIYQQTVAVGRDELQATALEFTRALRSKSKRFEVPARKLHEWLFKPVEAIFEAGGITSIVVVPDGVLRLVPFAALLDGDQFLLERFAISTSPGLSAMREFSTKQSSGKFLLAGLSVPGTVVEKLPPEIVTSLLAPSSARSLAPDQHSRAITRGEGDARTLQGHDEQIDIDGLKELLSLDGVKKEIEDIGAILSVSTPLMNETFTLQRLERDIAGSSYRVIHIASHGFFGDSAQNSFILTFDELLRLDKLKALLRTRSTGSTIDLITLSACQTAEGDDRAPLGFSGVAIKAGARSAIGTLWPVADEAATILMPQLYKHLANGKISKREALRMAQIEFIHNAKLKKQFGHPYFWAPFILVGD